MNSVHLVTQEKYRVESGQKQAECTAQSQLARPALRPRTQRPGRMPSAQAERAPRPRSAYREPRALPRACRALPPALRARARAARACCLPPARACASARVPACAPQPAASPSPAPSPVPFPIAIQFVSCNTNPSYSSSSSHDTMFVL